MHDRLAACFDYLNEVEAKLYELRDPSNSVADDSRLLEALTFIRQAINAVAETREAVEALSEPLKSLPLNSTKASRA